MPTRYSHPPEDGHDDPSSGSNGGVLLFDHLEDVAKRTGHVVPDDARTPEGEPLQDVVETLAYVHDFGKATTFFQDYLLESVEPDRKMYRYHAPLGSFAAFYALEAKGYDAETCLAGFVAVAKHHGSIPDVASYVFDRSHRRENVSEQTQTEQSQTAIRLQIKDILDHAPDLASEVFEAATDGHGSWSEFCERYAGNLLDDIESTVTTTETGSFDYESLSESCYALVLECWGSLVLADKTSAAQAGSGDDVSEATYAADSPSLSQLDEHVAEIEAGVTADPNGTRSEQLNHYRSRARRRVLENAASFAENGGGVATLTLPTGMGKTLSGLSAAMEIRDRTGGDRIVYALPFTSIIDQVVDEIEEIYDADTAGRLLTAHHHLSETTIRDEEHSGEDSDQEADDADQNDDVAGMLAESWRAGLTVTTFVQLFESLAGPANTQSMKLPALRDSVVILDEPQSLPLDWWKLVPRLVAVLTERYDATVIAMTATQPQLFDETTPFVEDATELVDDPDVYFKTTERVTYELDSSTERYIDEQTGPKSYEGAAAELLEAIADGESALAICNTIDSAQTLTEHVTGGHSELVDIGETYAGELERCSSVDNVDPRVLANRIMDSGENSVLHLSTRLRPVDRLTLIETAKILTEHGHPLVTVSTQLVEAGVDISFDRVYRDLAPIDSIVQAAGRCNRSFERESGIVTVWWLDVPEEQQKTPAEAVYNRGPSLLPVAAETLAEVRVAGSTLPETAVARTAVKRYYERLHQEKNVGKDAYPTYVDDARGDKLEALSLIEQRRAIDVVISRTDEDRELIEEAKAASKRYDFETVDSLMDKLRTKQISVPIYQSDSREARELSDLPPVHSETEIRCLDPSKSQFENFFDPTTGFVVPDNTVERRFL
ncbi:CRISPR-associated endonuclease Cas3'' [Salinadaptatus halalkaliphilus]|uniref:CRISPR-associated endonuclease Cas3 n=1 Tax=Salinadaptatus halalkaliphilus TaxID=2419781 RepID=A0A4S3TMI0_9EURY|nr:CRISPR-associated endonuclease Cas3'' [Salinadaptatus halalkaliphilus]THE65346.1 CRISPR-associated endonuclease Cas3'' [Salinadaptatus halalkaliphilus]